MGSRVRALIFMFGFALFGATSLNATAAEVDEAEQLVRDTFSEALAGLNEHQDAIREDPRVAYELMNEILAPHVDVQLMSRLILARHWADATEEQQARFVDVFRESLLRTYSRLLSDNVETAVEQAEAGTEMLRIQGVDGPDRRGRVNVRSTLAIDGQNIPIEFRMYPRDGDWKIFDVLIENISFVMNYRTEYDAELQRGDLSTLIQRLEERNQRAWTAEEAPQ